MVVTCNPGGPILPVMVLGQGLKHGARARLLTCYSCWSHGSWHTTRPRRRLLSAQPLELSSQSIISIAQPQAHRKVEQQGKPLLQLRVALLQTFDLVLLLAADGVKLLLLQRLPGFTF